MLKKISNIGDCGITCDFGDEVNKNTNKEVIKLFNFIQDSVNKRKIKGIPILKIETPNKGIANSAAGIRPIRDLKTAVIVSDAIISLNFIGAMNKLVKFLLHISSRNIIL